MSGEVFGGVLLRILWVDCENDNGCWFLIDWRGSGFIGWGLDVGVECVYCDSYEWLVLDSGFCCKVGGVIDFCCGLVGWGCVVKVVELEIFEWFFEYFGWFCELKDWNC